MTSPLIRHEISFIVGQIYDKEEFIRTTLNQVAKNEKEISIVRHEAILAYYDCAQDKQLM